MLFEKHGKGSSSKWTEHIDVTYIMLMDLLYKDNLNSSISKPSLTERLLVKLVFKLGSVLTKIE